MSRKLTFKNRDQWLEARKLGIGASEVGTILGVNPWETPLQLWRRKMGIDPPKQENFAMKAGHYLEDAVSKFFADETQAHIIQASADDFMFVDDSKDFLRVSPDRTFWLPDATHNEANKGILECKTTRMDVDKDYLPQYWYCQLQMNLHVAGYSHGALAWLVMGSSFDYKTIKHDPEFCEWMVSEIEQFWNVNIVGGKEPDPVNAEDILLKSPKHTIGKSIIATPDIMQNLTMLKELKEDIKANEQEAKLLEDKLKMAMDDAEAIMAGGKAVATWKAAKDSLKFDSKAFKAEHPELYESYCKPVAGSRRFLIK